MKNSAICLFSGGQDSTVCLYWAIRNFDEVIALSMDYGQKHSIELSQAKKIAAIAEVQHVIVPVNLDFMSDSSALLTDDLKVTENHKLRSDLPATFVPGRNMLFLTLASSFAYVKRYSHIVTGVCQEDYSGYPDCRDNFVKALQVTVNLAMDSNLTIHAPLMNQSKADIWALANDLNIQDLVVSETHTCYSGVRTLNAWGRGCGECPSCELREHGWEVYLKNKKERYYYGRQIQSIGERKLRFRRANKRV